MKHIEDYKGYRIGHTSSAEDADFYCRMGRFFADAGIRKELGGPITDSADHAWLVVTDGAGEIVAFSGYRFNAVRTTAWVTEIYVLPEHRRNGLFERLFRLIFALCAAEGAQIVKGLANEKSKPVFERNGWRVSSVRGSWTYYEKEVGSDATVVV